MTEEKKDKKKVIFCIPFLDRPTEPLMEALEAEIPLVKAAGWEEGLAQERGNPYVSQARNLMIRRALDVKADVLFFLDYDLSWPPGSLLKVLETEGNVVGATYRFRMKEEKYMGEMAMTPCGMGMETPDIRAKDGAIRAKSLPAGFLKITKEGIDHFMRSYPELCFGAAYAPGIDLFNHGAHKNVWYGEDYAFCRNWRESGGDIWCVPDVTLTHHSFKFNRKTKEFEHSEFKGNYHEFLLHQPGGSKSDNPIPPNLRNTFA